MKVLYLVSGIGPPAGWGTEYIQNLIFALTKKGIQATIINPIYKHTHPEWRKWTKEQEKKYNIKIISLEAPLLIKKNLSLHLLITPLFVTWAVLKLLSKEEFNLVHEFSSAPIILFRALLLKLLFKVPTVFTLSVYNNSLFGSFFWIKLLDFASFYIIPSKEIINNLINLGLNKNKILFLPPGINLKPLQNLKNSFTARGELNLPEDKFIISYFGPLTKEKGINIILETARILKKRGYNKFLFALFVIWKGSEEHKKLKELILSLKLNSLKLIEKYIDIPTVLAASDAILLPQVSGFGTTIPPISTIETLAATKPIITTNIIGNREWVNKKNGFLTEPNQPDQVIKAILKLSKSKLKKTNTNKIKINFDFERYVEMNLRIYEKIYG